MSAGQLAENQARLNVELQDIITFFQEQSIQQNSIALLNDFIEKHLTTNFLSLAEGYGQCMAFIDHEELLTKLNKCFNLLIDGYKIESKMARKKLNALKEDKKTDPDLMARNEKINSDIDRKLSEGKVEYARLRAMSKIPAASFKDPKFNFKEVLK
jgi:hypothetical protein